VIDAMEGAGVEVDGFCVGGELVVAVDSPCIGFDYELVEREIDGQRIPLPRRDGGVGRRSVWRRREAGRFKSDTVQPESKAPPAGGIPLLVRVMEKGRRLFRAPSLSELRVLCGSQLSMLDPAITRRNDPATYTVSIAIEPRKANEAPPKGAAAKPAPAPKGEPMRADEARRRALSQIDDSSDFSAVSGAFESVVAANLGEERGDEPPVETPVEPLESANGDDEAAPEEPAGEETPHDEAAPDEPIESEPIESEPTPDEESADEVADDGAADPGRPLESLLNESLAPVVDESDGEAETPVVGEDDHDDAGETQDAPEPDASHASNGTHASNGGHGSNSSLEGHVDSHDLMRDLAAEGLIDHLPSEPAPKAAALKRGAPPPKPPAVAKAPPAKRLVAPPKPTKPQKLVAPPKAAAPKHVAKEPPLPTFGHDPEPSSDPTDSAESVAPGSNPLLVAAARLRSLQRGETLPPAHHDTPPSYESKPPVEPVAAVPVEPSGNPLLAAALRLKSLRGS
jgi:hypothetical protein